MGFITLILDVAIFPKWAENFEIEGTTQIKVGGNEKSLENDKQLLKRKYLKYECVWRREYRFLSKKE